MNKIILVISYIVIESFPDNILFSFWRNRPFLLYLPSPLQKKKVYLWIFPLAKSPFFLFVFFLFTTFSKKFSVIEKHLLIHSWTDGAAGDSLSLHLSGKATGTTGLAQEHRWGDQWWQHCKQTLQKSPMKPGFLIIWASREIGRVKRIMKETGIKADSKP